MVSFHKEDRSVCVRAPILRKCGGDTFKLWTAYGFVSFRGSDAGNGDSHACSLGQTFDWNDLAAQSAILSTDPFSGHRKIRQKNRRQKDLTADGAKNAGRRRGLNADQR